MTFFKEKMRKKEATQMRNFLFHRYLCKIKFYFGLILNLLVCYYAKDSL